MSLQEPNLKKSKRNKALIIVFILVVVAFAAIHFLRGGGEKPPINYKTASVTKKDMVATVTATGTLSALVTVQVGSQVSGRIQEILVDYNSIVKKGDVLARIDKQFALAALEQAKANLIAAQSNLEKTKIQAEDAERQLQRNQTLAANNLVAQADIDTSQANASVAKAQVQAAVGQLAQAEAALKQADINLGYTTIYSPINGIVISRTIDVGQTVAASFQAPTLFTIAEDLRRMQVDTNVSEADVGKLKPDMAATFTVDAYPAETFTGKVRQIRNAPQIVQNIVTYDAVIDVENAELKLKPGMTASVSFIFAQRNNVLAVPNAALRFRPLPEMTEAPEEENKESTHRSTMVLSDGKSVSVVSRENTAEKKPSGAPLHKEPNHRSVWVLKDGKAVNIFIRTGITDGTTTELEEGDLQEGDEVIIEASNNSSGDATEAKKPHRPHGPF